MSCVLQAILCKTLAIQETSNTIEHTSYAICITSPYALFHFMFNFKLPIYSFVPPFHLHFSFYSLYCQSCYNFIYCKSYSFCSSSTRTRLLNESFKSSFAKYSISCKIALHQNYPFFSFPSTQQLYLNVP